MDGTSENESMYIDLQSRHRNGSHDSLRTLSIRQKSKPSISGSGEHQF